jgi:hypothetical protein
MAANASRAGDSMLFVHPDLPSETEKLLSSYFGSHTLGLCIFDAEFRFLAINNTLADMNGIPASEHLSKTVRQILGDFADLLEPLQSQASFPREKRLAIGLCIISRSGMDLELSSGSA